MPIDRVSGSSAAGSFTITDGALTPDMVIAMAIRNSSQMDTQIQAAMAISESNRAEAQRLGAKLADLRELSDALSALKDSEGNIKYNEINDSEKGAAILALIPGLAGRYNGGSKGEMDERGLTEWVNGLIDQYGEDGAREVLRDLGFPQAETGRPTVSWSAPPISGNADNFSSNVVKSFLTNTYGITPPEGNSFNINIVDTMIDDLTEQQRVANSSNEMLMMQLQSRVQQRTQIIQLGSNMLASIDKANDTIIGNIR